MNQDITIEQYMNLPEEEQIHFIESILEEMWDQGLVDLVGFDEFNQPLFAVNTNG